MIKKLCCSNKIFETSIRLWNNIKEVHKVIQFNPEAWLKEYINMNAKLRTEAQNSFKNDFFKLMKNSVF